MMSWSRILLFNFLLSWLAMNSNGQGPIDISKVKTQFLKYDTSKYEFNYTIPFKRIEVIDYRFDTSKVGYATYGNRDNHTRLAIQGGVESFLNSWLNEYFKNNLDPNSSGTLVIVLKKLWLEYGSVNDMLRSKDVDIESQLPITNRNIICLADMDVFSKSDITYQALVRLTNNFLIDKFERRSDFKLLLMPFDSLISKIRSMNVENTLNGKTKFQAGDIHTNYKKRFDIPVLSADSVNRGVFLSFNDFKNNKPAYPDFKYKKFELSTEVTILRDGKEVPVTEYWGFSDGKNLFVRTGFLPFKVIRQGYTFDMLGAVKSKTQPVIIPLPGGMYIQTSTVNTPVYPMQVDMETGKVY